jgi:hypothetical protein
MVYKRASKSSQIKFHKFLKKHQDSRLARCHVQLVEQEAIVVALQQEATDLTLEVEEQEEKLEVQARGYVRLMQENDTLKEEKEALVQQGLSDWRYANNEIEFQQKWKWDYADMYSKLLDKNMETEIKLVKAEESLEDLDRKYTDLLTRYFEEGT